MTRHHQGVSNGRPSTTLPSRALAINLCRRRVDTPGYPYVAPPGLGTLPPRAPSAVVDCLRRRIESVRKAPFRGAGVRFEALEARTSHRIFGQLLRSAGVIDLEPGPNPEKIEDRQPSPVAGYGTGR